MFLKKLTRRRNNLYSAGYSHEDSTIFHHTILDNFSNFVFEIESQKLFLNTKNNSSLDYISHKKRKLILSNTSSLVVLSILSTNLSIFYHNTAYADTTYDWSIDNNNGGNAYKGSGTITVNASNVVTAITGTVIGYNTDPGCPSCWVGTSSITTPGSGSYSFFYPANPTYVNNIGVTFNTATAGQWVLSTASIYSQTGYKLDPLDYGGYALNLTMDVAPSPTNITGTVTASSLTSPSMAFNGGTLQMNQNNTSYSQTASVSNSASNTIDSLNNNATFTGVFSNTSGQNGKLNITGTGKIIFAANNTYSGTTTINSGATLQLGDGGTTGNLSGNITNNGSLIFDRSNLLIFTET